MSEVILDTITGKSTATTVTIGSTPVVSASANSMTIRGEGTAQTSIQQGLAKAWVLGGDDASLTDSFNIASGTDNSTGNYTYAISNDMSNANFAASVTGAGGGRRYGIQSSRTTGTFVVKLYDDNESAADNPNNSKVHGDLA